MAYRGVKQRSLFSCDSEPHTSQTKPKQTKPNQNKNHFKTLGVKIHIKNRFVGLQLYLDIRFSFVARNKIWTKL